ncbi:MAG: hypothetical protein ABJG15_10710 [Hyphomonadaceae bacterium]
MQATQNPEISEIDNVILDVDLIVRRMADFDFRRANRQEITAAMELGEELVKMSLASPSVIAKLHEITEWTAWVTGDPVDGMVLQYPLSPAGEHALRTGTFTPKDPDHDHMCARGEVCSAIYCAIYAGKTHQARKNIMMAAATLRFELTPNLPTFARAATEDGARSMVSLGMIPIEGGLPDLFVQEPISGSRAKAA